MCGIFSIYYFDKDHQVNQQMVADATNTMIHRGPDDCGFFVHNNIGLGHRRLSIIDLSSGHQPITNEDGNIVIVYNGEIYNYREIRLALISKGHVFRTNCDTEVIVHAYEEWGTDCLHRFNGMFAFALWDNRNKKLWAVRDRIGIKPLYYYVNKDVFICASEIKAILKTGLVRSELNENVLDAYFSVGYVPGPETMFKKIRKVLPGHFLLVSEEGIHEHEYWDLANIYEEEINEHEAHEKIEVLLTDCVGKRLISDVPVGAFLSGGLDSSVVVALMSNLISPEPVNTFTVAYHQGYSEKQYAHIVAEQFKTNHHVFYLDPDDFQDSIKTLLNFAEEPIVEPAAIALYHIAKLARENAIVLLSGEGSDEVFAGYYLYKFMAHLEKARRLIPGNILRLCSRFGSLLPSLKYRKYLDWLELPLEKGYQGTSSYLSPSLKKELYHPDFIGSKPQYLEEQFAKYFERVKNRDPLAQMLYVDTKTWLVDDLLVKADKMTMAASIELRVPFLDHRLVETAFAFPSRLKLKKGQGKYLVKKIAEKYLPEGIIYRKKMGFPVPTNDWFRGRLIDYIEDVINDLKKEGWFSVSSLVKLLERHRKGTEDNSRILMMLVVLREWQNQYEE